jgi:hypothetical protein
VDIALAAARDAQRQRDDSHLHSRKRGKTFSTPVNYVRDGDALWTVSCRQRRWWRNLHDSPVTVWIQGKDFSGVGQAVTDQQAVAADLTAYLHKAPQIAKYISVGLDTSGQPNPDDAANAAKTRVMVRVQPPGS